MATLIENELLAEALDKLKNVLRSWQVIAKQAQPATPRFSLP